VELRVHTAREHVDFTRSDFHAAIRLGGGNYKGLQSEKVMDEWLVAVASPAVLARYGKLDPSKPLDDLPVLQGADEPWIHWLEIGTDKPVPVRGSVLDDSVSVLMAAEQGLGYALVRWSLAEADLQSGKLELASDKPLPYRWAYHLVYPKSYLGMPKLVKFRDWLLEVANEFSNPAKFMAEGRKPAAVGMAHPPIRGAPIERSAAAAAPAVVASKVTDKKNTGAKATESRKTGRRAVR
jgi:LysR family glycine cleavage system transcriptional activator